MSPFRRYKKGLSLWEVVLVTVIVGATAALAMPKVKMGIENRQAKQALETLRSIHHAIRMYEVDRSEKPANLQALQDAGYLSSTEYSYLRANNNTDSSGYEYSIAPTTNTWAQAQRFTTTTNPPQCREVCHGSGMCLQCEEECDPPTTLKSAIRTIWICKDQTKIRDVLGSSRSQEGLLSTIGTSSSCP